MNIELQCHSDIPTEQPRMRIAMASGNLPSSLAFKKVVRVCLETFGLAIVFELGPAEMTTQEIEMDEHRKCRRL